MNTPKLIEIRIDRSHVLPIKLKDLILRERARPELVEGANLNLKITLEKNVSVDIIDDTLKFEELLVLAEAQHFIEFVLNENSKLFYALSLKPNIESEYAQTILQELGDSSAILNKNIIINLNEKNAHAKIRIKCLSLSSQKIRFQTLQNHLSQNTSSCLCIKNVLFDVSKVECDNKIIVSQNACATLANQVNKNLLVGAQAHVISQPQLEIENDDVKCTHGAVTKTVDDEQLFYLQNRGLDLVAAKQLLIKGFLS